MINKTLLVYSIIMLFGTFISAISQVILKKSALREYENKIREYLNLPVISAYFIFFIATFLSVYAYKVVPLSMGPILESSSYIYVTMFGIVVFGEKITVRRFFSLLLILLGIVVYGMLGT